MVTDVYGQRVGADFRGQAFLGLLLTLEDVTISLSRNKG
jgi:hypothetical protein